MMNLLDPLVVAAAAIVTGALAFTAAEWLARRSSAEWIKRVRNARRDK